MEVLLEILLYVASFLGELLLQAVLEALAEVGVRLVGRVLQSRPASPWRAAFGYLLLGAATGGISLLLLPKLFIQAPVIRWLNLALSPLGCGLTMAVLGGLLRKHERETIRLDTFTYGFLFALSMAIVRFWWGG